MRDVCFYLEFIEIGQLSLPLFLSRSGVSIVYPLRIAIYFSSGVVRGLGFLS